MKKKNKSQELHKEVFVIKQIPKIHGIKKAHKPNDKGFISPVFGSSVKDVVSPGVSIEGTGDLDQKLEPFRVEPKLTEQDIIDKKGSKYFDFTSVSNEDRIKMMEASKGSNTSTEDYQVTESDPEIPIWAMPPKKADLGVIYTEDVVMPAPTVTHEEDNVVRIIKYDDGDYEFPPTSIFKTTQRDKDAKPEWLLRNIEIINDTLVHHKIEGEVVNSIKGPTVTRYEVKLAPGVPANKIPAIEATIMMNLAAESVRIEAPIPGKSLIGIEVPNKFAEIVSFGDVINDNRFINSNKPLMIGVGEDIDGENIFLDIAEMPHGLVAGQTGSGKSVFINTLLISLILKNHPDDLKLVLIDPKIVELFPYKALPHLATPVITDAKTAAQALKWAVDEMQRRYIRCAEAGKRDIKGYNQAVLDDPTLGNKMPYIIVVIDELADLMMVAANEVEDHIQRLTQKSRAVGIHLIVATQRPTVDIVKGTIKANIPMRLAFKVASYTDSVTILDAAGAEVLLGKGDMLIKSGAAAKRVQAAFITDQEITEAVNFVKNQLEPHYLIEHLEFARQIQAKEALDELDEAFAEVARWVAQQEHVSKQGIMDEFGFGNPRVRKIFNALENYQIIEQSNSTKPSKVIVTPTEVEVILGKIRGNKL